MQKVTADDQASLAYRVIDGDSDSAATLVLVHGWMMSGAVFDAIIPLLSGYRLVVPDLRGAGDSDASPSGYTIERYAKDVIAVADAAGAQTFGLVGHSMGGQIAQWVAATVPERVQAMALLNTVPAAGIPLPDEAVGLFQHSGGNRESQSAILGMACKELTDEARDRLLDIAEKISPECIEASFLSWSAGGFADKLSAITAPTFVLATDDPFLPPDFLRQAVVGPIAKARLGILPGPGHYPQVERPNESAALLSAFFAGAAL